MENSPFYILDFEKGCYDHYSKNMNYKPNFFYPQALKQKSLTIALILFFAVLITAFAYFCGPATFLPREKENMIIRQTQKSFKLAIMLKNGGYIRSEWLFLRILGNQDIPPGGYFISKNMGIFEMAKTFRTQPSEIWITIQEGMRKEEIADLLAKSFSWDSEKKKEFLTLSKEGYLFPDTFLIKKNMSAEKIIGILEGEFQKKTDGLFSQNENENIDRLVVASLVQREARNPEEMAIIAGIIKNRLDKKMPLQIDASVQYAQGTEQEWWPVITQEDYKLDSPYNTYKNKGLPPSPICNPGLDALKAASLPSQNSYLFYLHDRQGNIHYASTLEEHNANFQQYIK